MAHAAPAARGVARSAPSAAENGAAPRQGLDLRPGKGPGGALHDLATLRTPFFFYAPLCFAAPMLGLYALSIVIAWFVAPKREIS